jgi:hypothetical protein
VAACPGFRAVDLSVGALVVGRSPDRFTRRPKVS